MIKFNFAGLWETMDKVRELPEATDRAIQESAPHIAHQMDRNGLVAGTVADALEFGNANSDVSVFRDPGVQDPNVLALEDSPKIFNPHPAQFHNQNELFAPGPKTYMGRASKMPEIINDDHLDRIADTQESYLQAEFDRL